jgi:hypothetical protein
MGLRETIQQAVRTGLGALDNAYANVTYRSAGSPPGSYNTTTGTVTTSPTSSTVKCTFVAYHKDEIDGDTIRMEDQKALIGATQLTVTPTVNDTIVDSAGKVWSVVRAKIDPMGAMWVLQVRKP